MQCEHGHDDLQPEGGIFEDDAVIFHFSCNYAEETVPGYDGERIAPDDALCDGGAMVRADLSHVRPIESDDAIASDSRKAHELLDQLQPADVMPTDRNRGRLRSPDPNVELDEFNPSTHEASVIVEDSSGDRYVLHYSK